MHDNHVAIFWFYGYHRIKVYQCDAVNFLRLCKAKGVQLWKFQFAQNYFWCNILKKDFSLLEETFKKKGIKVEIAQEKGIQEVYRRVFPFFPLLLMLFFSLIVLFFTQNYIWKITIEGNIQNTTDQINDFLFSRGIYIGDKKKSIDYDGLEADIRDYFDNVTWVSVYANGTTLRILLKEKETISYQNSVQDQIIAPCDGKIEDVFIHSGHLLVKESDYVKSGDVLVDCKVPVFDENGEIIKYQFQSPEAEIKISYMIDYHDKIPRKEQKILFDTEITKQHFYFWNDIVLLNKLFKISNNQYETICIYQKYDVLSRLDLSFGKIEMSHRKLRYCDVVYTDEQLNQIAMNNLSKYILCLQEKGVHFVEKNVKIDKNKDNMEIYAELYVMKVIS